ncbi:hypothetical protein SAMN05216324_108173 [Chryseobacterium limigenitum]|uniref:Uncharacterized protein n=1 Tax=Chryseobacterium limigenitum TaxID=1612149 RepID=A0A1K2IRU6_9FLAO|nr:hypothetical protein SAMN05216324_108173 [Chryseobacterium limigenitum]
MRAKLTFGAHKDFALLPDNAGLDEIFCIDIHLRA